MDVGCAEKINRYFASHVVIDGKNRYIKMFDRIDCTRCCEKRDYGVEYDNKKVS